MGMSEPCRFAVWPIRDARLRLGATNRARRTKVGMTARDSQSETRRSWTPSFRLKRRCTGSPARLRKVTFLRYARVCAALQPWSFATHRNRCHGTPIPRLQGKCIGEAGGKHERLCAGWRAAGRGAAWLARLLWEQEVGGSNPPAPTRPTSAVPSVMTTARCASVVTLAARRAATCRVSPARGCSSMVELQPSKLATPVQSRSPARPQPPEPARFRFPASVHSSAN